MAWLLQFNELLYRMSVSQLIELWCPMKYSLTILIHQRFGIMFEPFLFRMVYTTIFLRWQLQVWFLNRNQFFMRESGMISFSVHITLLNPVQYICSPRFLLSIFFALVKVDLLLDIILNLWFVFRLPSNGGVFNLYKSLLLWTLSPSSTFSSITIGFHSIWTFVFYFLDWFELFTVIISLV